MEINGKDIEAIVEILGFDCIINRLYKKALYYNTGNVEQALVYFHKLKRVYEIINVECPWILIKQEGRYGFLNKKESGDLDFYGTTIDNLGIVNWS